MTSLESRVESLKIMEIIAEQSADWKFHLMSIKSQARIFMRERCLKELLRKRFFQDFEAEMGTCMRHRAYYLSALERGYAVMNPNGEQYDLSLIEDIQSVYTERQETQLSPALEYLHTREPESETTLSIGVVKTLEPCDCGLTPGSSACCVLSTEFAKALFRNNLTALQQYEVIDQVEAMLSAINLMARISVNVPDEMLRHERVMLRYRILKSGYYRLLKWIHSKTATRAKWMMRLIPNQYVSLVSQQFINIDAFIIGSNRHFAIGQGLTLSRFAMTIPHICTPNQVGQTVQDFVKETCGRFWTKIRGLFSFLSEGFIQFIDNAYNSFLSYMCNAIFGKTIGNLLSLEVNAHRTAITACCVFATWVIVKLMGIVTDEVANALYSYAMSGLRSVTTFVSQADVDPVMVISTLCIGVIGLAAKDFTKIKSMTSHILTAVAGGTVAANTFKVLLLLLPPALKMAFTYRFGTQSQRFEFEADRWKTMTQSLCAVSRLQAVLGSQEYATRVEEQVKEGTRLIRDCTTVVKPLVKQSLINAYVRLLAIHTNLVTRKYNAGDRPVPFCFHISGPAGIGKTTMVRSLLVGACELTKEEIYNKDNSDEFFSGLLNHKAIVMDEFLIGLPEANYETAQQFLTMVSSAEWRPPFASVDDPNVGIKGSTSRPDIIVTMNNVDHDRIDAKIDEAFWRRRNFVLRCKRSSRFIAQKGNGSNVDLQKYTAEQRRERIWMAFDILPSKPIHGSPTEAIHSDLSYLEVLNFVKEQYAHHREIFNQITTDMNEGVIQDKSGEEILQEVMRDAYDIPTGEMSLVEALKSTVIGFVGQGAPVGNNQLPDGYAEAAIREVQETGTLATRVLSEDVQTPSLLSRIVSGAMSNIVGLTAGIIVIIGAVSHICSGREVSAETFCAQSKPTNKVSRPRGRGRELRTLKAHKGQGPSAQTVEIGVRGVMVNAVPIGGRIFLTYMHSLPFEHIQPDDFWTTDIAGSINQTKVDMDQVVLDPDNDLAIILIDNPKIPMFKDIVKFFISDHEIPKLSNATVTLSAGDRTFYSTAQLKKNLRYVTHNGQKEVILDQAILYTTPTETGDCGNPVKVINGGLANKIVGIHVAGTGGTLVTNPSGIASIVTQDFLREARQMIEVCVGQGPTPNLEWCEEVAWNEIVPVPINSKLTRSAISDHVPWESQKQPAILSQRDRRSRGICPIDVSLNNLYATTNPDVCDDLIRRIEEELCDGYDKGLSWPAGKRQLTFEEACGGIPGVLNSLNMTTSPGYPLVHVAKARGKTDFIWFEGQELKYTEEFKEMVLNRVREMDEYVCGEKLSHRFLGYLKDELRKMSKILNVETRMIFANDVVSLVAFRMKFGALLCAFMHSFEHTGFAIGLNQYSKDMQGIYHQLSSIGTRYGDGDYKGFDQHYVRKFQEMGYRIICYLAKKHLNVSDSACRYMVAHEIDSPFQIGKKLVKVFCSNLSGLFWTTIINCIVNRGYVMYCFYLKYPHEVFALVMKLIVLGDDMIYSIADRIEMTPKELGGLLKTIGQEFTSADKATELEDVYKKFEQLTFLGARPRISRTGEWTGALRKDTLLETPMWTRDKDCSLDQTVQQMIDCASQWDQEFFEWYVTGLKQAYQEIGRNWVFNENYSELHYCVLNRTAASGADFVTFVGQGPMNAERATVYEPGLTQMATAEETDRTNERGNLMQHLADHSLAAEDTSLDLAVHGWVKRGTYTWSSTAAAGTGIGSFDVPFGLLKANNTSNMQDVGFFQFLYSQPEVEIKIMVNGTPVQQGALVAYFQPLYNVDGDPTADICDYTTFDHVFITPNNNSASTLTIPFRYWKTWLNNKIGFTDSGSRQIGAFHMLVLSPLTTLTLPTTASVALYTRMKSKFRIARPRTANGQGPVYREPKLIGQGATYSTSNVSNSYTVGNVAGSMPSQTTLSHDASQGTDVSVPMDNPPLVGSSVPVHQIQPSMAKAIGVEPTFALQMHPEMMHREPDTFRFQDETSIARICERRGYLPNGLFTVTTSDSVGQEYINLPLNSVLGNTTPNNANKVPANLALLNQFQRVRFDLEVELFMAKTVFHSTRLLLVMGYGYNQSLASLDYDSFPNRVLEFTGENQWVSTIIPYNAATEFLRTYDGNNTQSIDNYSMGNFSIICLNPLKVASAVVSTSCAVLMFVKFRNVQVYEPRVSQWVSYNQLTDLYQFVGQGPMEATSAIVAPEEGRGPVERHAGDDPTPEPVSITGRQDNSIASTRPCSLTFGRKYEYTIKDIVEVGRRHYAISPQYVDGWSFTTTAEYPQTTADASAAWHNVSYGSFYVYPLHPLCGMFGGWSGHLKYRLVITNTSASNNTLHATGPFRISYVASTQSSVTETVPHFSGTIPATAGTANSSDFSSAGLWNSEAVVGKTGSSTTSTWNANTYIYKPSTIIDSSPIEFSVMSADSYTFIDFQVPFSSNNNMLPCLPKNFVGESYQIDPYNGKILFSFPQGGDDNFEIRLFQAFGDDFRLHCYSPVNAHYSDGFTSASFGTGVITTPANGQQVGQNVYGPHA